MLEVESPHCPAVCSPNNPTLALIFTFLSSTFPISNSNHPCRKLFDFVPSILELLARGVLETDHASSLSRSVYHQQPKGAGRPGSARHAVQPQSRGLPHWSAQEPRISEDQPACYP